MTKSYKDKVNAYNPPNWGQKYSIGMSRGLSTGASTWKGKIYTKGKSLGAFIPNNEMSFYYSAWDFVTKFVNWDLKWLKYLLQNSEMVESGKGGLDCDYNS